MWDPRLSRILIPKIKSLASQAGLTTLLAAPDEILCAKYDKHCLLTGADGQTIILPPALRYLSCGGSVSEE